MAAIEPGRLDLGEIIVSLNLWMKLFVQWEKAEKTKPRQINQDLARGFRRDAEACESARDILCSAFGSLHTMPTLAELEEEENEKSA